MLKITRTDEILERKLSLWSFIVLWSSERKKILKFSQLKRIYLVSGFTYTVHVQRRISFGWSHSILASLYVDAVSVSPIKWLLLIISFFSQCHTSMSEWCAKIMSVWSMGSCLKVQLCNYSDNFFNSENF